MTSRPSAHHRQGKLHCTSAVFSLKQFHNNFLAGIITEMRFSMER